MEDLQSTLEKYKDEVQSDLTLDDFSLHDKQMQLPAVKHKWVARLIQHKAEKSGLQSLRVEAIQKMIGKYRNEAIVELSDRALYNKACESELVVKIDKHIQDNEILIVYLDKVEKICAQATFDIKNIIEIKKLETT